MIVFDAIPVLWAAPVVAIAFMGLALWGRRARITRAARWSPDLERAARAARRYAAPAVGIAGLLAMVALAGPRFGFTTVMAETAALDVVLVADISRSMLAEDVVPSRLARMQGEMHRLIHDLQGSRIGMIAFAGRSFILSPLTVDGSALQLLVDGLHPDMASIGGSMMGAALRQGRELLLAGSGIAERVLVVFTDGEAHDSLPDLLAAADLLKRDGIRLILVGQGEREGVPIPLRGPDGSIVDRQLDQEGQVVLTRRRDDIMAEVADAAQGALVAAALDDQAGAVRDLLRGLRHAPQSAGLRGRTPRAWIPLLAAALVLLAQGLARRTGALVGFVLLVGAGSAAAQTPRNQADDAWRARNFDHAAALYRQQAEASIGGDTTWFNAGTAALAVGRHDEARAALERAAASLDPDLRFRALYNLGLLSLRLATSDSASREAHLADARRRYREALLINPSHADAKWNLELALAASPPPSGGGGEGNGNGGDPDVPPGTPPPRDSGAPPGRLTREQVEQILATIANEERQTRQAMTRRMGEARMERGERDW